MSERGYAYREKILYSLENTGGSKCDASLKASMTGFEVRHMEKLGRCADCYHHAIFHGGSGCNVEAGCNIEGCGCTHLDLRDVPKPQPDERAVLDAARGAIEQYANALLMSAQAIKTLAVERSRARTASDGGMTFAAWANLATDLSKATRMVEDAARTLELVTREK
jgi:hypothetical protein